MTDVDTNRLRNWAKAYQRLMQGGLDERAHTACVDDFAADDGEFPYITAADVLMLLGEVEHLRFQVDVWKRIEGLCVGDKGQPPQGKG